MKFFLTWCSEKVNLVWKGVWIAIVWEIWKHRKNIVFNGGIVYATKIFMMAQLKAWSWVK